MKTSKGTRRGSRGPERSEHRQLAEGAGLSLHQMYQALDVASIPEEEFEALVESDAPPTISELAHIGRKRPPKAKARGRCPHCGAALERRAR